jgi:hypothetical protein
VKFNGFDTLPYQIQEDGFELLSSTFNEGICTAHYRISKEKGPNDLISKLLPHVNILSFYEKVPSMNDVFISTIKQVSANQIL